MTSTAGIRICPHPTRTSTSGNQRSLMILDWSGTGWRATVRPRRCVTHQRSGAANGALSATRPRGRAGLACSDGSIEDCPRPPWPCDSPETLPRRNSISRPTPNDSTNGVGKSTAMTVVAPEHEHVVSVDTMQDPPLRDRRRGYRCCRHGHLPDQRRRVGTCDGLDPST